MVKVGTFLFFFSRANPLYVQAISTLLPPDTPEKKSVVDPVDRCQGESRRDSR